MSVVLATNNMAQFGQYPVAQTFANNDNVTSTDPDTSPTDSSKPGYSAAFDPPEGIKRHSACDECRKRKLKCSGEPTACTRCIKQKLICHYSEQKTMGRPRKRQKTRDSPVRSSSNPSPPRPVQTASDSTHMVNPYDVILDPALSVEDKERQHFESICNAPIARAVQQQTSAYQDPSDASQENTALPEWDPTGSSYPTDVALWPDFTTLDLLPAPVEDNYVAGELDSTRPYDPDANPEALMHLPPVPACPCLPNLYLTLSTLSTLSSFPFTRQTITTIESSYKTSKGVIYCTVCPQKFDSGSSNLMLGTTLINVLADQWNRFRKLGVDELRNAFGVPPYQNTIITTKEGRDWRNFQNQVLRAYVYGDQSIPHPPGCPNSPAMRSVSSVDTADTCCARVPPLTLLGLCESLERRQRQWHRLEEPTDEFPDRVSSELQIGHMVGHTESAPGKHLCLEIVNHAKFMITGLQAPIP